MIKRLIKNFFTESETFTEELESQRTAFLFVSIVFALTSILLLTVILKKWNLGTFFKNLNLGLLILINSIGYFSSSLIAAKFAGKIRQLMTVEKLFKLKSDFFRTYLVLIGLPTVSLALWAYIEKDIRTSLIIFSFSITAVAGMLYFDRKDFKKLNAKWGKIT